MTDKPIGKWRNRSWLILLFVLFFTPALLAWLLVLGGWRPAGASHHGELIQPPVPVAELPLSSRDAGTSEPRGFAGLWSLLLIVPEDCTAACEQALDRLQRVRIALNKDAKRVQLLLVLPPQAPTPALPMGFKILRLPAETAAELARPPAGEASLAVHMIDPYEFRMMKYSAPLDAQGLLKDLQRLLRLSNEDIEQLRRSEAHHG